MTDFTGTWRNQNGSQLELRQLGSDVISGRFDSGVGDNDETLWVEVTGRALGDLITFHAIFSKFDTVVSWVGQHTIHDGIGQIRTHWLHASNAADQDEPAWLWYTNRIGNDTFVRA